MKETQEGRVQLE